MNSVKNIFEKILTINNYACLFIVCIIFLVYSPTLFYKTVKLDDQILVLDQYQFNRDLSNLSEVFNQDIFQNGDSFYRPMLRVSFMWDAQFGERNVVFMSHLTNIILHIIAVCLFYSFLCKLKTKKSLALFFALVLALHPLTTQTVSWIPGRNDSLLAIFALASFIFFLNFLEHQKLKSLLAHLGFLILALWTKETAIVIPVVLVSYIFIFKKFAHVVENSKNYLLLSMSWVMVVIAYLWQRMLVLGNIAGNHTYNIADSISEHSSSIIPIVGKIFFPVYLSVHPVAQDMPWMYGILALIILVTGVLVGKYKSSKLIIFGLIWFLAFIMPTLIQPKDVLIIHFENRIYLPMLGFVLILLGLQKKDFSQGYLDKKSVVFFISILLLLTSLTLIRNHSYANALVFWKSAVLTSPNNVYAHGHLGGLYAHNGQLEEAVEELRLTIQLDPEQKFMHSTHRTLGEIYLKQGKIKEAEEMFLTEKKFNPNNQPKFNSPNNL